VASALAVHPQREQIQKLHDQGVPITLRPMKPKDTDAEEMVQAYIERFDEFYSVATFPFSMLGRYMYEDDEPA